MNADQRALLQRVRDTLPPRLNAGILMGDGGFCALGWMLFSAGFHPITMYANTLGVVHPELGGPAVDVVARTFGVAREDVVTIGEVNDATPTDARVEAVRRALDDVLARGAEDAR